MYKKYLYTKGYYPSRISTQDGDLTDMDIYVERIYNGIIKGCIRFDGLVNQNPDVSVLAFSESDRQYFNTTTDKNGNYTLTSMPCQLPERPNNRFQKRGF
jgi:hypothetical protein